MHGALVGQGIDIFIDLFLGVLFFGLMTVRALHNWVAVIGWVGMAMAHCQRPNPVNTAWRGTCLALQPTISVQSCLLVFSASR